MPPTKQSLKKEKKLQEKKQKKQLIINPQEILKLVENYNKEVDDTKKIIIHETDCLNEACTIIGTYLKNPNSVSIKPSYSKTMPKIEKLKGVVVLYKCGLTHTFAGAGGLVVILPLEKKYSIWKKLKFFLKRIKNYFKISDYV
jgi:hypothetical protein